MGGSDLPLLEADAAPGDLILVGLRPAIATRHDTHAIGPQRVKLAHRAVERHRFDIGIAGELQMREHAFPENAAPS